MDAYDNSMDAAHEAIGTALYGTVGGSATRKAREYQDLLAEQGTEEAMNKRKQKAASTALGQARALSAEQQAKAAASARKQGLSRAAAASYGSAAANQNLGSNYANAYNNALAQENQMAQSRLEAAKAQYDVAMAEKKDKRDTTLGVVTSILGILSDERLKVIYDKWNGQRRK